MTLTDKQTLAATTAVLAASLFLAAPATAQSACSPAAPADGDTVICGGTGTGIIDDGLDDATITVEPGAVIIGAAQGFEFDDGVTFSNAGTITGEGDHGVQGDNGVTVTNTGTITGEAGDGVNIDNDGEVVNSGTITGSDDGVQLEANARVRNLATGVIIAADEGVNINTDGAFLSNDGLIEAGDDGVNAAENAVILNTGTIRSTGDQDGIDLDSGTITNSGLIISMGNEDGIDFDVSTNASTVTNTGRIEGAIGINTDPTETSSQSIINSGEIIGRSGVAMNLGGGDDTLEIGGGRIEGSVELGDGNDTLRVTAPVTGAVRFTSDPETVDILIASALYGTGTLVSVDPARFGAADLLGSALAQDLAGTVSRMPFGAGSWVSQSGSFDGDAILSGRATLGHDFGRTGLFLSIGRARTDDAFDLSQTDIALGLRHGWALGANTSLTGVVTLGHATLRFDDAAQAKAGGVFAGLAAHLHHREASGLTLRFGAGVTHTMFDSHTAPGLADAGFAARNVTTGFVEAEIGRDIDYGQMVATPYVGIVGWFAEGDEIVMSHAHTDTSFAATGADSTAQLRIGTTLRGASGQGWTWRLEARFDSHGAHGGLIGASLRF